VAKPFRKPAYITRLIALEGLPGGGSSTDLSWTAKTGWFFSHVKWRDLMELGGRITLKLTATLYNSTAGEETHLDIFNGTDGERVGFDIYTTGPAWVEVESPWIEYTPPTVDSPISLYAVAYVTGGTGEYRGVTLLIRVEV